MYVNGEYILTTNNNQIENMNFWVVAFGLWKLQDFSHSGARFCLIFMKNKTTHSTLVSGAFAEVNVEAQRLIVKCAKHAAAALEDKSDITPEEISSAKGSAYNLLL